MEVDYWLYSGTVTTFLLMLTTVLNLTDAFLTDECNCNRACVYTEYGPVSYTHLTLPTIYSV